MHLVLLVALFGVARVNSVCDSCDCCNSCSGMQQWRAQQITCATICQTVQCAPAPVVVPVCGSCHPNEPNGPPCTCGGVTTEKPVETTVTSTTPEPTTTTTAPTTTTPAPTEAPCESHPTCPCNGGPSNSCPCQNECQNGGTNWGYNGGSNGGGCQCDCEEEEGCPCSCSNKSEVHIAIAKSSSSLHCLLSSILFLAISRML